MKRRSDLTVTTRRVAAAALAVALLVGTSWSGRAVAFHANVDPALRSGDTALIQVQRGTVWSVARELVSAGASDVAAFESVDILTARVSDAALAKISSDRAVRLATADAQVVAVGGGSRDLDTFGSKSDRDSLGAVAIHAPLAWAESTGRGVVVALMDSGIAAHTDLPAGKVVGRVDFVNDAAPSLDPAGHGTHLAGVIAANGATFKGVAPDARLVDIRILDRTGSGTMKQVVAGFDWLLKNRGALSIRVLNLSFGTTQSSSYHQDLLSALVEAAWFSGIAVAAAAGNEGPVAGTITTPGADPFIITAGSFDDEGTPAEADDRESSFSSLGPTKDGFTKPDVLAPGRRVVSLRSPGSMLETDKPDRVVSSSNVYIRMSGTSVSSAMVSGVAALVLGAHQSYTPTQTKGAIVGSGRRVNGSTTKAVDAQTALSATARVNTKLVPSKLLMTILVNSGVATSGVTWEGVTWEGVTWESVTWESVTWESVTWESVSWESITWEKVRAR